VAYLLYSSAAFASGNLQLSITPKNNNLEVKILMLNKAITKLKLPMQKGISFITRSQRGQVLLVTIVTIIRLSAMANTPTK
jgi:hypothetical protein